MVERPDYVLRMLERFAAYGERDAIVGVGWPGRWTYTQVRRVVLEMAAGLRDAGFKPGMTVGVVLAHPPEGPMLQLALHLLGCRTAWLDVDTPRRDVDEYLAKVAPEAFVYDTRTRHGKIGRELAEILGVATVCLGPDGLGPDLLTPDPAAAPFDVAGATGSPESIFQTTGTTGAPKLIHHGAGLYEQMSALGEAWVRDGQPLLRHLSLTPLWHAAGQAVAMLNLVSGGVLFILFRFRSNEYLATIAEHRANSVYISPLMLNAILDDPALDTADTSVLELLNVGGAAVTPARLKQAIERFGPVVRMTYGLSELPFISAFPNMAEDPARPNRLRSVGPPYGDVRIEIRDERGNVLAAGEVGELWARSRLTCNGYWAQPELTAETLVDGWLRTKDLGYADDEGYLHLVGRAQDLIITGIGGEHIFPRPIEEVLGTHPQVRAAAVIGVPHPTLGEAAHAYVVTSEPVAEAELTGLVERQLGESWVPQEFEFLADLPRTNNGKVDVKSLKAKWATEHEDAAIGAAS